MASGRQSPDHTPVDLVRTIRPELDEVDKALIAELEETTIIRATASRRTDIAKAVGKYVSAHKNYRAIRALQAPERFSRRVSNDRPHAA